MGSGENLSVRPVGNESSKAAIQSLASKFANQTILSTAGGPIVFVRLGFWDVIAFRLHNSCNGSRP
jgi:hypothetical protein